MREPCVFHEAAERRLNDHAERIRLLEIGNASQNEKIDSLCRAIEKLATRIDDLMEFLKTCMWKALGIGGTVFMVFLGFFIWYVQGL
jgi:uncharacterized coiled-coil protein SlyX